MHRILVAADEPGVIRFLRAAPERAQYNVTTVTSGRAVIESLKRDRFDLLVLDLDMPDVDGFEVLRVLRAQMPYLRIVVVSGYMRGALLDAARQLGATATLPKPIDLEELRATIAEIIGSESQPQGPLQAVRKGIS